MAYFGEPFFFASKVKMEANARKLGIVQISLSGMCFGFLGTFGKILIDAGLSSGEVLFVRFLCAACILWPIVWIRFPRQWILKPRQIAVCALLGMAGYAVFSSWYFIALKGISASLAVLLLYTYPVIVSAYGWIFWGQKIPKEKRTSIPLALIGLISLVWGEFSVEKNSALLFGIGAAFLYAAYILISSRLLKGVHPLVSVTYVISFAALGLGCFYLDRPSTLVSLTLQHWTMVTGLVIVSTVGAMSLFLAGLQKLHPWEVSLLSTFEPLMGVAMANIFLGEHLTWLQLFGALSVILALVIVSLRPKQTKKIID